MICSSFRGEYLHFDGMNYFELDTYECVQF